MNKTCKICLKSDKHKLFQLKESMFGWAEVFEYFECNNCGCLQITNVPVNIAKYYPENYYSYQPKSIEMAGFKSKLGALRDSSIITGEGILGKILVWMFPPSPEIQCFSQCPLQKHMKILDVGCGSGILLKLLYRTGFRQLLGVDPYLPSDTEILPGLILKKQGIEAVGEEFDLIVLNHVFEHIEDGQTFLTNCCHRLKKGGRILLRIPTAGGEAWKIYKENWVQLDAPRHCFLHTTRSLNYIANRSGLTVAKVWNDSTYFQFWGSELYKKGYPLVDENGNPARLEKHFTTRELRMFKSNARHLNKKGSGDQLVALLKPQ
jgi:SAM-dependent methyltransferase